jgi:hypothetical protein
MLKLKQTWNTWKLCKHSNGKLLTLDLYSIHKFKKNNSTLSTDLFENFHHNKKEQLWFCVHVSLIV